MELTEDKLRNMIAVRIRSRRKALGLTQRELAAMCDEQPAQICRYETERHFPGAHAIVKLSIAMNCSTDFLLGMTTITRPVGNLAKRDARRVTVGELRLKPNSDGILEWRAPRAEYPVLHILDGGGFLYTGRTLRQEHTLTNVDGREDQETADALWFAIMRSRVKAVVAFREEWLR